MFDVIDDKPEGVAWGVYHVYCINTSPQGEDLYTITSTMSGSDQWDWNGTGYTYLDLWPVPGLIKVTFNWPGTNRLIKSTRLASIKVTLYDLGAWQGHWSDWEFRQERCLLYGRDPSVGLIKGILFRPMSSLHDLAELLSNSPINHIYDTKTRSCLMW